MGGNARVIVVRSPKEGTDVHGYQIPSSVMRWLAGEGLRPPVDRLRVTQAGDTDLEANRFFVEFYRVPDAHLEYLAFDWLTMGQVLSTPMIIAGAIMLAMAYSAANKKEATA